MGGVQKKSGEVAEMSVKAASGALQTVLDTSESAAEGVRERIGSLIKKEE